MQKIHLEAPKGWINDPNGFIYYKGKYHLFYQHFPYAPRWGRMHWGHAVSDDLFTWEHKDIALFPTKTHDADGCFSGSAVEHDGKMHIYYTGVKYTTQDPENVNCCLDDRFTAAQLHISSDDGYSFDNFNGKTTVIPPIEDKTIGDKNHTRDPKVWHGKDGKWYMVVGSTADEQGRLLFYRSSDLENWEYVNFSSKEGLGWMWECPDFFETDGQGVLIFSPMGIDAGSQAVCTFMDFNESDCSAVIDGDYKFLDYGLDLYAPQSTVDAEGRRIVIAWLRMPEAMADDRIGLFSIPRVCTVKNSHIYFAPHPNVQSKFNCRISKPTDACGNGYKFNVNLNDGDSINVGGYVIGRNGNSIYTDRSAVINGHTECGTRFETPPLKDGFDIEVYVDKYIIEVYVNGGEYVISNAVYGLGDELRANTKNKLELFTV